MFSQDFNGLDLDWDLPNMPSIQATEWDWRGLTDEPGMAPSEDFWKKFEELPDLGEDLESLFDVDVNVDVNELSNVLISHDCMWTGTCLNKDHKPENKPPPPPPPVAPPVMQPPSPVKKRGLTLVKPPVRSVKPEPRPDTPTSLSESEEDEVKTQKPADATPTTQNSAPIRLTIQTSAFDHNYDRTMRPEDYGIQTPSDSEEDQNQSSASEEEEEDDEEEEIDVVSLTLTRDSLPTNPTRLESRQLQKKVASAITTNSLLSAQRAVSRRLKQTKKAKRKRASSDEEEEEVKPEFYVPQQSTPRRSWKKPSKKSRFSDSEPDSDRRSLHNNMERMRRIDLRNAFDELKGLLPSLVEAQRAPKVTILKDATSYLHELRQKENTLSQHVTKLRSHQEELRSTLSRLRKTLAAIR